MKAHVEAMNIMGFGAQEWNASGPALFWQKLKAVV
jgi:hypothetical protein